MTQATQPKKKVLYIVTKSNFGGAQRYVYDLATGLSPDSYDVAVAFGGTGVAGSQAGMLAQMLAEAGVRTILVPELGRNYSIMDAAALWTLTRLLRHERPDVVHLNSSKAAGLGSVAARIAGVPRIIFTAHGWPFWERLTLHSRTLRFIFSCLTVLFSHATICISEYDRRAMARVPFVAHKLHVVRNGIATISFLSRDSARASLFSPDEIRMHHEDLWVLSNGELTANKNYLVALDAIAQHNDTSPKKAYYAIMGSGEQRELIEREIVQRGLSNQVKLLGFVPDGRRFYAAFDVFFLPSKKEGVPYVILEAGRARLPVVASRVGGIPEVIVSDTSGILCQADDASAFSRALANLTDDTPLRERLGTALEETIAREYSMERMIAQTIAVY